MATSKVFVELARVSGNQQLYSWLSRVGEEEVNSWLSGVEEDEAHSIDNSQLIRLHAQFFNHLSRTSWETVKDHCRSVIPSECFVRRISPDQWLRTALTYEAETAFTILSNVVPREAYSRWFAAIRATCPGHQCIRGFFSTSFIFELGEQILPPRQCCAHCALAEQLNGRNQSVGDAEFANFRYLEETEMRDVDYINEARRGSEGEFCKILWRQGTFGRKRFICDVPFQNKSFEHEFDVALEVAHPNIVHCFGFGCAQRIDIECSLFMEWLEVDLERFLHERARDELSPFSFRETLVVLLQVAEAMKHVHQQNFVHGDLKPGNILMSQLATPDSKNRFCLIKVADFGNAQRVDSSTGATVEPFCFKIGSYFYIAPEVWRGRRHKETTLPAQSQKIDVYSFGVVAYEVLTGVTESEFPSKAEHKEGVLKPDTDRTQWRPNRGFDIQTLGIDRRSLLPLISMRWAASPQARPTFSEICHTIQNLYNRWFPSL